MKLTIGTFDGLHLGHQAILKSVDQVVTFANHPHTVLKGEPPRALTTLNHKIHLLKQMGFYSPHILSFTKALSQKSAETFLLELRQTIPFTHLLLGYDAIIGRGGEGTPEHLQTLAERHGFTLNYLDPITVEGNIVSSSEIRRLIQAGELEAAATLLGRPYSIFSTVEHGAGKGRLLGFHTANINVDELALPPLGVYAIEAKISNRSFPGIANLGKAPTLQNRTTAALEAHLFDLDDNLYGMEMEVLLHGFLRKERCFASPEDLKKQIEIDIQECRNRITSPS